jgi:hypothetical protein
MGHLPLKEEYLELALGTTSEGGPKWYKILNDIYYLELQGSVQERDGASIRDLLSETRADFVGLQETMKKKYTIRFFRTIDPNRSYGWH